MPRAFSLGADTALARFAVIFERNSNNNIVEELLNVDQVGAVRSNGMNRSTRPEAEHRADWLRTRHPKRVTIVQSDIAMMR
jgi:hypothetical protein